MKTFNMIYILTRCIIGAVFIYAGTAKLLDPGVFASLIEAYGILPEFLIIPASLGLPLLEITAGIGLIFDKRGSLSTITVLLIIFIAVLGYGISMGLDIDCGCFGQGDPEIKAYHGLKTTLYRDILLLLAGIYLYTWRRIKEIKTSPISCNLKKYFQKENLECINK